MLFIVKGKSHNEDRILRIHANDEAEAEAIGWKRANSSSLYQFSVSLRRMAAICSGPA